jgi:hypothetical protein
MDESKLSSVKEFDEDTFLEEIESFAVQFLFIYLF